MTIRLNTISCVSRNNEGGTENKSNLRVGAAGNTGETYKETDTV